MSDSELYNKHRPGTFAEVVGQEHVTKVLESYMSLGNLPQSLIFYGSPGCGKTTTARIIAKLLNSHSSGTIEVNSASDGGVNDMRGLEQSIYTYPSSGEHKTYIFDEAHRISAAGFDSLLKVIEEPPSHVTFIFVTTNIDPVPGTVRSRSDLHTFYRISHTVIETRLKEIVKVEGVKLTPELISLAADAGAGSLRDAIVALNKIITMYTNNHTQIDIVKSLGIVGPKCLTEFCLAYLSNNHVRLHKAAGGFNPDVVDTVRAIHSLQSFVLDSRACLLDPKLVTVVENNVETLLGALEPELLAAFADKLPRENYVTYVEQCLLYIYDMSLMFEDDLRKTSNYKSLIDRFVIKLVQSRA